MDRRSPKKKESRVVKEIQEQQQSVDDTVMEIAQKGDDLRDELSELHESVMRRMRRRILGWKKRNGGLSREEEQEFILLGGC